VGELSEDGLPVIDLPFGQSMSCEADPNLCEADQMHLNKLGNARLGNFIVENLKNTPVCTCRPDSCECHGAGSVPALSESSLRH